MNKDNGGPAFPCDLTMYDAGVVQAFQGATLRDYFAAKAMQTLVDRRMLSADIIASTAYLIADEMLKARQA